MVASAVFITDLQGKAIISRNYRGDVPLTKAIENFASYLTDVEEEAKKPIFHVDVNGDIAVGEDVGGGGVGGEHYIYVNVSTRAAFNWGIPPYFLKCQDLLTQEPLSILFLARSTKMYTCVL